MVVVDENKSKQQAWKAKLLQWSDRVMKSLGNRCHPMASGGVCPCFSSPVGQRGHKFASRQWPCFISVLEVLISRID